MQVGLTHSERRLESRRGTGLALWLGIWAALVVVCSPAGLAARGGTREYEIKAAYLYNFLNYIEWPEQSLPPEGGNITIGVIGENPFGQALDPLKGKQVKGRTLTVKAVSAAAELKDCQIVFISSSEKDRLPQIFESLKDAKTVTVSEIDGFAQRGGIINFVYERNRVRFEINQEAARSKGLTISSDLLKLARLVKS
jgi:YfiR/HmsC-like